MRFGGKGDCMEPIVVKYLAEAAVILFVVFLAAVIGLVKHGKGW